MVMTDVLHREPSLSVLYIVLIHAEKNQCTREQFQRQHSVSLGIVTLHCSFLSVILVEEEEKSDFVPSNTTKKVKLKMKNTYF